MASLSPIPCIHDTAVQTINARVVTLFRQKCRESGRSIVFIPFQDASQVVQPAQHVVMIRRRERTASVAEAPGWHNIEAVEKTLELIRFRVTLRLAAKGSIMASHPRSYPPEFRQKIMELIRSGDSGNTVARRFNVSGETISNWLKQDVLNTGRRTDRLTSDERAELPTLRRDNKRLKVDAGTPDHGASRRRTTVTTVGGRAARPARDLVDRNFTAEARRPGSPGGVKPFREDRSAAGPRRAARLELVVQVPRGRQNP